MSPCYQCEGRHVGCHEDCELYISWALKLAEEKKKKLEQKRTECDCDQFAIEQTLRRRKKWKKQ